MIHIKSSKFKKFFSLTSCLYLICGTFFFTTCRWNFEKLLSMILNSPILSYVDFSRWRSSKSFSYFWIADRTFTILCMIVNRYRPWLIIFVLINDFSWHLYFFILREDFRLRLIIMKRNVYLNRVGSNTIWSGQK